MVKVFYNRSQKPACLFQKPSWITWFSFHHCSYQTARATDTANWLLTSKAAHCWSSRVNRGALGGSSCRQHASEQLKTSFGGMTDLPAISVSRGTQCNAKLPTAFKKSRFLWWLLSFLCVQVSRALAHALYFKVNAEVLCVFLTWCLQTLATISVRKCHPSEY